MKRGDVAPAAAGATSSSEATYVLVAAAMIVAATTAWWALALWPAPTDGPAWLARTRLVCFGVHGNALPDLAGWLALVGEPLGMAAVLLIGWPGGVREVARRARRSAALRMALRSAALALLGGALLASWRIGSLLAESRVETAPAAGASPARLDRPAPPLELVDQHGRLRSLTELRGRPVLLTFAYAHCETMCPLSVHAVVDAAARLKSGGPQAETMSLAVVVVTLDPWRDTPARLPALAKEWALPEGALVLGGSIPQVEAALDAWKVARSRDARTGEITHAPVIFVLDARGRVAYQAAADADAVAALVRRL